MAKKKKRRWRLAGQDNEATRAKMPPEFRSLRALPRCPRNLDISHPWACQAGQGIPLHRLARYPHMPGKAFVVATCHHPSARSLGFAAVGLRVP